jgi:hypothetical protein
VRLKACKLKFEKRVQGRKFLSTVQQKNSKISDKMKCDLTFLAAYQKYYATYNNLRKFTTWLLSKKLTTVLKHTKNASNISLLCFLT